MAMIAGHVASGLWRWLPGTGMERFELEQSREMWLLRGTILAMAGSAAQARYEIVCDKLFRTQSAEIEFRDAEGERQLEITTENGCWYANGREVPALRGVIDIDLGWSPSTNTLPIRRLGLQIGEFSNVFSAAWVRFPELVLEPLPQEYRRLAEREYLYSSRGGAFKAKLLVDEHGLVMEYEGFWQRIREGG